MYAAVYSDAWAPSLLVVRVRGKGNRKLVLHCENKRSDSRPMRLEIRGSWGDSSAMEVNKLGRFKISVPIPEYYSASNYVIFVTTLDRHSHSLFARAARFALIVCQCASKAGRWILRLPTWRTIQNATNSAPLVQRSRRVFL